MQHVVFLVLVGWGVEERYLPPFLINHLRRRIDYGSMDKTERELLFL